MGELNNRITFQVVRDLREEAFRHIQELPLSYLDRHPNGETVSRIVADVDQFADGLLMGFTQLFTGLMTIGGTLLFMLLIHWKIALVVIFITPVSLFVAQFVAKLTPCSASSPRSGGRRDGPHRRDHRGAEGCAGLWPPKSKSGGV